ncbi:aspartic peptidase A1 [Marasmius fiardii PR-910]|nr:aspartic peptidase A1 [Marasmius fiardii PR-910]
MVTLPLKRVEQRFDGVHPQIYLQQHINRGNKRLARMSGREIPSNDELSRRIVKRVAAIEGQDTTFDKRFNRSGLRGSKRSNHVGLAGGKAPATFKKVQNGGASGNGNAANGNGGNGAAAGGQNSTAAASANGVEQANQPATANSLGLDIEGSDIGYLATIQMGTPPKDFSILMDSGSADLWVGSENCQEVQVQGQNAGNHNFLGAQSSSTFKDSQQPFQVTYGTGAVAGTIVQDNIVVAGLKLNAHTFGTAQQETQDFADNSVPFDGLMGLAQSTLSEQKTLTPIEALAKNGLVQDAITSFKISRAADNKNDGEITFGGLDATKFDQQSLVTLPNVNKQGFWEGAMDAVTVDGQDTQLQGRTAILDTGTTLIVAPANDAAAVHKLIQGAQSDGQGGFVLPCTFNQTVALSFGGTTFAIDPRDMVVGGQPVAQDPQTGEQFCLSGISEGNIGGAQEWLVGDVFLKNAYFSTDVGKNTVSLAKLV